MTLLFATQAMADYKHTAEMRVEHFNALLEPQVKTHGRKQSGRSFSSKTWMIALAVLIVLAILVIIISIILATILRSRKPVEEGKQIRRESRK